MEGRGQVSEENKEKSRRLMEDGFGKGRLEIVDEVLDPDFVCYDPNSESGEVRGADTMKQEIAWFRNAVPDLTYTVIDQVAEGNKVVTRYTASGTHQGEFFGVDTTGLRRSAGRPGTGVDLDPGHSRATCGSPNGRTWRGEGPGGAPGALARRLAVVCGSHPRARRLFTRGSRSLCAAWRLLGGRLAAGTPRRGGPGDVACVLDDIDHHRWPGRGTRLAGVRAPAAAPPTQRTCGQPDPRRTLGAVAPSPDLDAGSLDVSTTHLADARGHTCQLGRLYLGFSAHPRKRASGHVVAWGGQPVQRVPEHDQRRRPDAPPARCGRKGVPDRRPDPGSRA